jgi:hypothetical protein
MLPTALVIVTVGLAEVAAAAVKCANAAASLVCSTPENDKPIMLISSGAMLKL